MDYAAAARPPDHVVLCLATGGATTPYVVLTVPLMAGAHGHEGHGNDLIPAPPGGCPGPRPATPTWTPTETPTSTPPETPT